MKQPQQKQRRRRPQHGPGASNGQFDHSAPRNGRHGKNGKSRRRTYNNNNRVASEPVAAAPITSESLSGILQFREEKGDGQLRDIDHPLRSTYGIVVPRQLIRELNLRPGLLIQGHVKGRTLNRIDAIEGAGVEEYTSRIPLYDATALDPQPAMKLEHDPAEYTTRAIDLIAPIGFGQRGLIVAPPRTGKTILLQNIARGIHANYPDTQLVLLLVDERPEEVTDMRRNVPGIVYASSNDNTVEKHLDLAQLIIERCKRQVEFGKNVVVLMDSLTRLGRAFNVGGHGGGRTLSGGLDQRALEIPKRLFGAARKVENGGSLTILATCLIDTGSRMDQVIFEEFKGTGNLEITLDRNLSNQRIFPAINITESGTRKEEKLLSEKELAATRQIRRHLLNMPPHMSMKTLLEIFGKFPTNEQLYNSIRT